MEQKKSTKYILIAISVLFIFVMLILPLFSILFSALKEGFAFYLQAVTTEYVRSALLVTLLATVIAVVVNTFFGIMAAWLLTKFSFRGKQVLATLIDIPFSISPVIVGLAFLMTFGRLGWTYPAIRAINQFFGTNIRITFALPGVVLATIFVTFPFVSREIIPILNAQGKDEEEAAALMGLDKKFKILGKTLNSKQQQIGNGVTQAIGKFIKKYVLDALNYNTQNIVSV